MPHAHHTLKQDLTRTLLVWSGLFFVFLGIVFLLSFNALRGYILDLMAEHRLQYQAAEFAKHLDQNDDKSIQEEGDALIEQPLISAILLVDASGQLMHASITPGEKTRLQLSRPLTSSNLASLVGSLNHLKLYTREIPGHHASLALIMDDRPVTMAILATTAWTALLMLLLLGISIFGLHRSLDRRLVSPLERVRASIESRGMPSEDSIVRLENELPEEAAEILDVFQQLRHSHQDLKEHIVEMMQLLPACFWWSTDGRHYAGASSKSVQVLKLPPDALAGSKLWSWGVADATALANRQQLAEAIRRGDTHVDLAYPIHQDGDERWFGESLTIRYDHHGEIDCIYGIINDISARKRQQQVLSEQIQMAERMDTTATLVGGIAHEFNNALAGMQGNLYLVRQHIVDAKDIERLDRIENLIRRAASMIEQMLVFARRSQLRPERIDLVRFLREYEVIVRPTLSQNIRFTIELPDADEPALLFADAGKLQEALTHLLHNAVAAVADREHPDVRLSLDCFDADEDFIRMHPKLASRRLVRIRMQDNGCGIPEEVRKHIFEPFFTTREVGQGTGLGLPMVYGFVRRLGGIIQVDSVPGEGTTIDLYLPRREEQDMEPGEHSGEILHGHGETILIVDDEDAFRETAAEVLAGLGYRTRTASSGRKALEIFGEHGDEIALVVLDVVMPDLNGTETAMQLRRIRNDIPILFATAYDLTHTLNGMAHLSGTDIIHKPFRIAALSQSVQKLLTEAVESTGENEG